MIDTHCHLHHAKFSHDLDEVLQRAWDAGVTKIVTLATSWESCRRSLELAEAHENVYACVGIHPTDVTEITESNWRDLLRDFARHPKVAAIGETGLDYFHEPPEGWSWDDYKARQKELFRGHLELAAELGLNVVVHQRKTGADAPQMVREFAGRTRAVFHCWDDSAETAQPILAEGNLVSFTGIVTYPKNRALLDVTAILPLDSFMMETDAPYLAPQPRRGKRCEPADVIETAKAIASIRGMTLEEITRETTKTAESFFRFT